jgi:predicted CopG family antitoxin
MKHLNIPVDDDTYEQLAEVKGDRSWPEALREEFGIDT